MVSNGKDIQEDYYSDTFMQHRIYTSLYGFADELRDSLHSSDLSEFIYLAQKSTQTTYQLEENPDLQQMKRHVRPIMLNMTRFILPK